VTNKVIKELKVAINGAGAAGLAITRLLLNQGIKDIILVDSRGIIYSGRKNLNLYKQQLAKKTNKKRMKGGLKEAMVKADVFIGVSKGNLVNQAMVKSMNKEPIIFAMANPIPEIKPNLAQKAKAAIVGTGRSDYPNQINNALVFPGIFRGLLDSGQKKITNKMKVSAAIALAYTVKNPTKSKILPNITEKKVVKAIAKAIIQSIKPKYGLTDYDNLV
jgi:malate dehydrogenase (oxaloacetate-decarboxylating)